MVMVEEDNSDNLPKESQEMDSRNVVDMPTVSIQGHDNNDVDRIEEIRLDVDDETVDDILKHDNGNGKSVMHGDAINESKQGWSKTSTESTREPGGTKSKPGISLYKLFHRNKRESTAVEKEKDPEAGTELLSKNNGTDRNGGIEVETRDDSKVKEDRDVNKLKQSFPQRLLAFVKQNALVLGVCLLLLFLVVVVLCVCFLVNDDDGYGYLTGQYAETVTQCGNVQGKVEDGAIAFRGIPYSVPPVGEKRWKPSELVQKLEDCWEGTYQAHNHTKLCYQKPLLQPYGNFEFSEDCLYLDVYTPRVTYDDPMPVVVYFAGDSFQGHDTTDINWRPSAKLSREKQVVFVVVYYRMNAFGFLALELLTNNVHPPTSGNYGIYDMLTALKWVNRNIEGFGGNASKITVLGHGSGATAILALLSSRLASLLFNQAWITGGSAHYVNKTLREVERNNEAFNRHLMCDTTECLYSKAPEQILNAIPVTEWPFWGVPNYVELPTNDEHTAAVSIVDGAILYDTPDAVWKNDDFVDVSVVIGSSVHNVAFRLLDEDFENFDWERFNNSVRSRLGTFGIDVSAAAIDQYYDDEVSPLEAYVTMLSDLRVTCPLLNLAYRASKQFSNNVYFYLSTYVPDGGIEYMNLSYQMAAHGLDIAAIFNQLTDVLTNPSASDLRYQETIQDMFYTFVEHGRPSSATPVPKMPWTMNYVSEVLQSLREPYTNCDLWINSAMYPKYARMN